MRLGLLASGRGSNADAILTAIDEGRLDAEAMLLIADRPAEALDVAERHRVPLSLSLSHSQQNILFKLKHSLRQRAVR